MRDMPVYVWVFVVNQADKKPSTVYARVWGMEGLGCRVALELLGGDHNPLDTEMAIMYGVLEFEVGRGLDCGEERRMEGLEPGPECYNA